MNHTSILKTARHASVALLSCALLLPLTGCSNSASKTTSDVAKAENESITVSSAYAPAYMKAGARSMDNGTADPSIKRDMEWYKKDVKEVSETITDNDPISMTSTAFDETEGNEAMTFIEIYPDQKGQVLRGLGTSLDESTVYNLSLMSGEKRKEVLRTLIDPVNGAGMTIFRLPLGASDFTHADQCFYSYYDVQNKDTFSDPIENPDWYNESGNGFSIEIDRQLGLIDTIHDIQSIAEELGVENDISFFASPWSLPGWMKEFDENAAVMDISEYMGEEPGTTMYDTLLENPLYADNTDLLETRIWGLVGGQLDDNCMEDAAMYFRRYLEEYAEEGIDVAAITLQNEPGQASPYPNGLISAQQEARLAAAIQQTLEESEIEEVKDTLIFGLDYNATPGSVEEIYPGAVEYLEGIMETNSSSIDGAALHDYSGGTLTMDALAEIHETYPDLELILSERSLWGTYGMDRIVQHLRNNVTAYSAWVTMLDSDIHSHQLGADPDPTILIQDAADRDSWRALPDFWMLSLFNRNLRPGDIRIESTDTSSGQDFGLSNVAFMDPETGEISLIVVNNSDEEQPFHVQVGEYGFDSVMKPASTAAYTWTMESPESSN